MTSYVDHPLHVDARGSTATTGPDGWLADLVAQVLFTNPGERVHHPDFGSGLLQLVFAPGSSELATTVQFLVQGSLQQWLGHLLEVEAVDVVSLDEQLLVTVSYVVRRTGERRQDQFQAGART